MGLIDIYHGEEGEERINQMIWGALKKHYPGAVDPNNPSLMAERLFRVIRSVYIEMEFSLDQQFDRLYQDLLQDRDTLTSENRQLKGLPPIAVASGDDT
jgi:hypothetical protein